MRFYQRKVRIEQNNGNKISSTLLSYVTPMSDIVQRGQNLYICILISLFIINIFYLGWHQKNQIRDVQFEISPSQFFVSSPGVSEYQPDIDQSGGPASTQHFLLRTGNIAAFNFKRTIWKPCLVKINPQQPLIFYRPGTFIRNNGLTQTSLQGYNLQTLLQFNFYYFK